MEATRNQAAERRLSVDYTVKNISKRTLYLFDPDPPYVLVQENGEIVVAFYWFPVPENIELEVVEQPGVIELPPSTTKKGSTQITIPIKPSPPYDFFDARKPPLQRNATGIRLAVGFVSQAEGQKFVDTYCRGKQVRSLSIGHAQQQLVVSGLMPISVPILMRQPVPQPLKSSVITASPLEISLEVREISSSP